MDYFQLGGIDTYTNPELSDARLIHSVNMVSFPFGGLSKRPGYSTFLNNPDNAQVNTIRSWPWSDGTTLFLYRASGSSLYYSQQGTGNWTLASGGTLGSGTAHFGAVTLNGVYIGGDGVGSTRHTTNGSVFTNTSGAPVGQYFAEYQNQVFIGAGSVLFQSASNDATNWTIGGTSDSTSFDLTGEGAIAALMKVNDYLVITKNRRSMLQYDGNAFVDLATTHGPSSPYAIGNVSSLRLYMNQYGIYGFNGALPELLSNPVQQQFYNRSSTGISGSVALSAPGVGFIYDYFVYQGTITDSFTGRQIPNSILKYDYQKNTFLNWSFANTPTAFAAYVDSTGQPNLLFGDTNGNTFLLDNTTYSDNGAAIASEMVFLFTYNDPNFPGSASYEKKWDWIRLFFNPGCEVNIQAAFANTYSYQHLTWFDITDQRPNVNNKAGDGIVEFRFPQQSRSRLLFLRIYESSNNSAYTLYGMSIKATPQPIT